MALSARNPQLLSTETVLRAVDEADQSSCDLARDIASDNVYNQQAFRYFIAHERKRSELSNRPFLLLLVDLQQMQIAGRIDPAISARLFDGLTRALRDTDVVGWYHEGRVAGAVLTHVDDASGIDIPGEVRSRVTGTLREMLPASFAERLQVRVYQLPAGSAQ